MSDPRLPAPFFAPRPTRRGSLTPDVHVTIVRRGAMSVDTARRADCVERGVLLVASTGIDSVRFFWKTAFIQVNAHFVLAEALDRFSRDQEDTAGLFKRLTFAGVSIVTLAEGDITHLHVGLKGTMNALPERSGRQDTARTARSGGAWESRGRSLLRIQGGARDAGCCSGHRRSRDRSG